jgi:hypothetical protein
MKVHEISVNVRYSKPMADGSHKTVELAADASIGPEDDWQMSQALLYTQLAEQMRVLWKANGVSSEHGQNGHEKPIAEPTWEEIQAMPLPQAHFCPAHKKPFKRFEKGGNAWYSHKQGDSWCREGKS